MPWLSASASNLAQTTTTSLCVCVRVADLSSRTMMPRAQQQPPGENIKNRWSANASSVRGVVGGGGYVEEVVFVEWVGRLACLWWWGPSAEEVGFVGPLGRFWWIAGHVQ